MRESPQNQCGKLLPRMLLLFLFLSCCASVQADALLLGPDAVQRGYSLERQWSFLPGDELAWADPAYDSSGWSKQAVPGRWPAGGFPESNQFAWYRLSLVFDLNDPEGSQYLEDLAVRLGKVLGAYELYAGGRLVGGAGSLPPAAAVDFDRKQVFRVPAAAVADDGTLVLALRVWGGDAAHIPFWRAGPFRGQFTLGQHNDLIASGLKSDLPGLLVSVLFVIFGLYHLYLYSRSKQLNSYLWYGLLAINIGIYSLMLTQWKYMLGWPLPLLKKIELGAIYIFPALGIQMMWALLQRPINRWLRAYQLSFVAFFLAVVLVPGYAVMYHTLPIWQYWIVPALVLLCWLIVKESLAGNREARTLVIGVLIFVATGVNDLLIDLAGLENIRLLPFGFVAIMLSMSVSLANRFTDMLAGLEDQVAQRTVALSQANERLAAVARIDPLTELLNRRGFSEEAREEARRMHRSGRGFSLVLADVDFFKGFNDQYGHACGDHVLTQAAAIFRAKLRAIDQVGRWGGEEFIILLPETDPEGAFALAEKLCSGIAEHVFEFNGQSLGITMSFGISSFHKDDTLDACIARADKALYRAKEQGRNKVLVFADEDVSSRGSPDSSNDA